MIRIGCKSVYSLRRKINYYFFSFSFQQLSDPRRPSYKMDGKETGAKKKKQMRISDDIMLDTLRFFNRPELCSFKFINRRMKRVIELGDRKKQLRQRFVLHKLHLSVNFLIFCD